MVALFRCGHQDVSYLSKQTCAAVATLTCRALYPHSFVMTLCLCVLLTEPHTTPDCTWLLVLVNPTAD
jgi:hypothetical protein